MRVSPTRRSSWASPCSSAGNDSTKATFSNGMIALLRHPEQWPKLVDDPSKIPGAVEEFLRLEPAFSHFRRTATRDVEFGDS